MFYQRVVIRPGLGKAGEVKALLEERVRSDQSRANIILTERVFGQGQGFVVGIRHDNLEAYEKEREFIQTDPGFQAFAGKLEGLLREPRDIQLYRMLSSPPADGIAARFTHLVRFKAVRGKETEVQQALEEFAGAFEAEGGPRPGILRRAFSLEGPVFVLVNRYQNLTEYENISGNLPPSIRNLTAKTNDLITEPTAHALFEVIVPFSR